MNTSVLSPAGEPFPVSQHLQEALYVCAEILTTVGYGDVSPSSYASQAFCAVYSILGCSLIAAARRGPAS
jgi:hypothetical protein